MSYDPLKAAPQVSGILTQFKAPETQFASMVKTVTKMELPPGPMSMGIRLTKSFEKGQAPNLAPLGQPFGGNFPQPQQLMKGSPLGAFPKITLPKIAPLNLPAVTPPSPVGSAGRTAGNRTADSIRTDAELMKDAGLDSGGEGGTGGEEKSGTLGKGKVWA